MSEKKELPKLYIRKFINEDRGSAYIIVNAEVEDAYNEEGGTTLEASIELKDCNKQINLEFDVWSSTDREKEYKERLNKLDVLMDGLQQLKDFMLANPPIKGTKKKVRRRVVNELLASEDEDS